MDDELAAIAQEILDYREGLPDENGIDGDIGKYMTFSEEENDVKIEIKNDEILSMTSADDESGRLDFQGFECSFDPNAFENVDQQANEKTHQNINNSVSSYLDEPSNSKSDSNVTKNASNSKQKKKRGRRSKNVDKEEELISDFEESTPQQPESQNGLDEINDCPESPFDDGCLNKSESVGTRRKSTRDSDEKEEELPLKRTRRRINLGDASTTTSTTESELEMGHKILKQLMSFPGSTPFLDRPDMSAHGMTNYYVVVKKPMWLKAVLKRYNEDKYPSITELIADIRLVLENCYLYWGTGDPLTKKALRVEELLEKKLATLPSEVRDLCSLKATHGEDPSEDLSEENKTDETNQHDSETSCQNSKKSVFISRLLQRVVNNSETNSIGSENSVVESVGTDVEEWEKSVLYNGDVENEIASMWELPLIGQFLNLALDILSIGQISQYEVERMLLIPQASTVLARIMTSMLVTPFSRVKLEEGPPMPYEFWTNKLKKKLASWYRTYRGTGDLSPVKVFDLIGIEPEFWLVMGESNPLEEMQFHELKFIQRVWILKTLCDYLLHNHKSFQEKFNNLELDDLRESYLGRDKQGFAYHYFPEFYEVRIYKRAKVPDKRWNDFNDGVDQMIFSAVDDEEDDSFDENEARDGRLRYKLPRSLHPSPKSFKMVAKCVEDVRCLLDVVSKSSAQNGSLLKRNLSAILAQLEPNDSKIENSTALLRKKMHKEWLDYTNRPKDYVDPGASYWSKKELRDKEEKAKEDNADFIENVDNIMTVEKRERRSTRENQKYVFDELEKHLGPEADGEDYEQPDEEDDSEDEWVATPSKKKKKQQNVSQRKIKKLQTLTQKLHNKTDDANRTVETNNIYVRKFPTENSDSSSVPPSSTTNSIRVRKFPTENSDLSFGQSNSTSTNIRVRQFPTESSRLRFGTSSSTTSDQVIVIKDEPDDVDSSNNVQSNCVQPPPPPPQSVPSTHPPPPPVIPLTHYVKQEALKREAGEYNAFQVKSESTVIRRKSTSKSDEVINLLSDDEDEASDVLPVDEDVKPVVKTIECVVNCLVENSQNVVLPPTIQQPSMIQSQFVQKQQISSPQQIQAAPFPQMLPPQPTMIFNQRNNIVQPPPQMAPMSFPNNNPSLMQRPPTSINSPPFATVKQEPGTFVPSQQQQQPVAAPMFNSLSPQQQSPRMRGSPQMVRGSPSSRGRMMSQQSPRMMTSPRMMATSPRMMGQQSRSPMLQRGGRMPMPNMGRGSPQNMRQHSPQTFPQRGNMTSPQFGSPQRNNMQARRNLNFNSPSRPQTSNPTPSPSRNNLASNSSDRPKERLHIINSGGVVGKNTKTVEGKLVVAMNDDGSYGYFAVLSDGGKLTVSQKQISELRSKCNGSLPDKVGIPMVITD